MILLIFFIIVGFWALNFCHSNEKLLAVLSNLQDTFPDECFEEKLTFGKQKSFYSFSVLARSCWNLAEKSSEGMSKLHCLCPDEFLKTTNISKILEFFSFPELEQKFSILSVENVGVILQMILAGCQKCIRRVQRKRLWKNLNCNENILLFHLHQILSGKNSAPWQNIFGRLLCSAFYVSRRNFWRFCSNEAKFLKSYLDFERKASELLAVNFQQVWQNCFPMSKSTFHWKWVFEKRFTIFAFSAKIFPLISKSFSAGMPKTLSYVSRRNKSCWHISLQKTGFSYFFCSWREESPSFLGKNGKYF